MRDVPGGGGARRPLRARTTFLLAALLVGALASGCTSRTKTAGIDWISFVEVRGRQYVAVQAPGAPRTSPAVLGRVVAKVKKTLAGHVFDPHYRPRDGDAAFLAVGTQLREVHGFAPWFRLGALVDGNVTVFQLDRRTGRGADAFYFDVDAIRSLEIRRASDGSLERTVVDPALVRRLVAAIDRGRIHADDTIHATRPTCVVGFTYADTPSVTLGYWASPGATFPGITLDSALRSELAAAGCR